MGSRDSICCAHREHPWGQAVYPRQKRPRPEVIAAAEVVSAGWVHQHKTDQCFGQMFLEAAGCQGLNLGYPLVLPKQHL